MLMNATGRVVAALALFLSLSVMGIAQTRPSNLKATSPPKFVDTLMLTTSVTNKKGKFVSGLKRENFRIFIGKESAEIIDVRQEDVPLSVGIVFDASGSASDSQPMNSWINYSQQSLKRFLESSNQANEYFLMGFNVKPQLLLDWTSDSNAIIDRLGAVQAKGNTAFYDACYVAIDKVRRGRYSRGVLILISDGQDNISTYTFRQVCDELKASGVLVYSVNFSRKQLQGDSLGMEGQAILHEFGLITGGLSFYQTGEASPKIADAISVFENIAQELTHHYSIAVRPNVSPDNNKWHKIRIKVETSDKTEHLSARTREGVYLNHR